MQRVGLQKALFSSPAAAASYARNRIDKLRRKPAPSAAEHDEIAAFEDFLQTLERITPERFSKYQRLLTALRDPEAQWTGRDSKDRLVVFSERIETLKWLFAQLPGDLKLKEDAFTILEGGLSDIDQQEIVERFGQEHDSLRVLLCSDVASEGLNLHYLCHRLVHFDLPWSPMVFQQRNGRVDRFGQEHTPRIDYLLTESEIETVKGDLRVIEVLVRKDEQISRNIGDPASILRKHSIEEEEQVVADALASGMSAEQFERECIEQAAAPDDEDDWEAALFGTVEEAPPAAVPPEPHRFFPDVYAFAKQAISQGSGGGGLPHRRPGPHAAPHAARGSAPPAAAPAARRGAARDRRVRAVRTPRPGRGIHPARPRAGPPGRRLARHPVSLAPAPHLPMADRPGHRRRGPPARPGHRQPASRGGRARLPDAGPDPQPQGSAADRRVEGGGPPRSRPISRSKTSIAFCRPRGLGRARTAQRQAPAGPRRHCNETLGDAVATMQLFVEAEVRRFSAARAEEVERKLAELDELRGAQERQLELRLAKVLDSVRTGRRARRLKDIEDVFTEYGQWVKDSLEVEPMPFVQVLAGVTARG